MPTVPATLGFGAIAIDDIVYVDQPLSAGKGKPKLKASEAKDGDGKGAGCQDQPQSDAAQGITGRFRVAACRNMTMAAFAENLRPLAGGAYLAYDAIDETKLAGAWDFELKWCCTPPTVTPARADTFWIVVL